MVACLIDGPDEVQALLQTPGIMINKQNDHGDHALMVACQRGHAGIVKLLLTASTDKQKLIMLRNKNGWHALMCACEKGHVESAEVILNASTNKQSLLALQNKEGQHALALACEFGCSEVVKLILDTSTDKQCLITLQKRNGANAFVCACIGANNAINWKILLEMIFSVSSKRQKLLSTQLDDGSHSLMLAAKNGHIELARFILSASTDKQNLISLQDNKGKHALLCAYENKYPEIAQLILNECAEKQRLFFLRTESGLNALWSACDFEDCESAGLVFNAAIDMQDLFTEQDEEGRNVLMYACWKKTNPTLVQMIIDASIDEQKLITQQDKAGRNVLMYVQHDVMYAQRDVMYAQRDAEVVKLILDASIDKQSLLTQQDKDGKNILMHARKRAEVVELILAASTDIQYLLTQQDKDEKNVLMHAWERDEVFQLILDASTDRQRLFTQQDKAEKNILMHAWHNAKVVKLILDISTDKQSLLTQQDKDGKNILMYVWHNAKVVKLILDISTDKQSLLTQQDMDGKNILMHAQKRAEVVELILDASTDRQYLLTQQDKNGMNALAHFLLQMSCMPLILKFCEDKDEVISQLDKKGNNALMLAANMTRSDDKKVFQLLLDAASDKQSLIAQSNKQGKNAFMCVLGRQVYYEQIAQLILDASTDRQFLTQQDNNGKNAFMYACEKWNNEAVKLIFNASTNKQYLTTQQDNCGKTALMYACENWTEGVQLILDASSDKQSLLSYKDQSGKTALMYICEKSGAEVVQSILNACSDKQSLLAQQDRNGMTALMYACDKKRDAEVVQAILDASLDKQSLLAQQDQPGMTALMYACRRNLEKSVRLMINSSTNKHFLMTQQDNNGKTPLMHTMSLSTHCDKNDLLHQLFTSLLNQKKNPAMLTQGEKSSIFTELILSDISDKQSVITLQDKDGRNVLMYACECGSSEAVNLILNSSSDKQYLVTQQSKDGRNSLMYACEVDDQAIVKLILKASSDKQYLVTQQSNNGRNSLMYACKTGHSRQANKTEVIQAILDASQDRQCLIIQQDKSGKTAFDYILEFCSLKTTIELLFKATLNMQQLLLCQDHDGKTILMHTCSNQVKIKYLLDASTDIQEVITLQDNDGKNVLMHACIKRHAIQSKLDASSNRKHVTYRARRLKVTATTEEECRTQQDKDDYDNSYQVMQSILQASSNKQSLITQQDKDGKNVLMYATRDEEARQLILSASSDKQTLLTQQDCDGRNILMHVIDYVSMYDCTTAKFLKLTQIIKTIFDASTDRQYLIAQQDKQGKSSFIYSFKTRNFEVVSLILDMSSDQWQLISQLDHESNNSLIDACDRGDSEIVQLIVDKCTRKELLFQQNRNGTSALMCACKKRDPKSTELILNVSSDKQSLLTLQDRNGKTALMFACESNMIEIVNLILNASSDKQYLVTQQSKDGKNCLMYASESGNAEMIQAILNASTNKQNLITQINENSENALLHMLQHWPRTDSVAGPVQSVLEASTDQQSLISHQDKSGWDAVMAACHRRCYEVVEFLLDSTQMKISEGAIAMAIKSGSKKTLKALLRRVKISESENIPLGKVVQSRDKEIVALSLKMGATIDAQDADGMTPLMLANDAEIVNLLLECGATINMQDHQGRSALHHRLNDNKPLAYSVIELLLRRGANPCLCDSQKRSAADILFEKHHEKGLSGGNNDPEVMVEEMMAMEKIRQKYPRTLCDDPLLTHKPLVLARGQHEFGFKLGKSSSGLIVKKVVDDTLHSKLSEGDCLWKVNQVDVRKHSTEQLSVLLEEEDRAIFLFFCRASTLLKEAIKLQDTEKVNHVLESHQICVNSCAFESSKNPSIKLSALMLACEEGNLEMAEIMINRWHADVDQVSDDGWSALSIACLHEHYELAALLLEKGDVNLQNSAGWSSLMFVCREGHFRMAELLLQKGADVNLQNENKWTALMIACEKNHSELVRLLLEKKAEVNLQKDDKGFALKIASQNGSASVVKQLLDHHAEVNMQNDKGWISLMTASKEGHFEIVELLLERKADVDVQNEKGWSALMSASEEGHEKVVELLLGHGANIDLQSHKGDSALSLAVINRHAAVISVHVNYIVNYKSEGIDHGDDTIGVGLQCEAKQQAKSINLSGPPFPDDTIPLTLNALSLLKWNDEEGNTHSFHLLPLVSSRWEEIGQLLGNRPEKLAAIKREYQSPEICWSCLMEEWLLSQGTNTYPATWEGIYSLLLTAGLKDTARSLKSAISRALVPSASSNTTRNTETSDRGPPSAFESAENPLYSELKQQLLFRDKKPVRPPKQGTEEFDILNIFCQEVEFIIQAVNENEYQAAVTLMRSPCSPRFPKAVVFPHPNTVIGMFGDKKACLLFSDQGLDCSDYVQDAIEVFPNTKFVVGVGIGYAFDRIKHKLGDVLVSKQICNLQNPKFYPDEIIDCGERVNVVMDLMTTFCMNLEHEDPFSVSDKKRCSKVKAGRLVSFPATINNKKMCDKIQHSIPEAIGGDMEGGQLLKFMLKRQIEGVALIRGVSHYGDGTMGSEWEFTASLAALNYVSYKLGYYQNKHRKSKKALMGSNSTAAQPHDTAVGSNSTAAQPHDTVVGSNSTAAQPHDTAVGSNSTAAQPHDTVVGLNSTAAQPHDTVVGLNSTAAQPHDTEFTQNGAMADSTDEEDDDENGVIYTKGFQPQFVKEMGYPNSLTSDACLSQSEALAKCSDYKCLEDSTIHEGNPCHFGYILASIQIEGKSMIKITKSSYDSDGKIKFMKPKTESPWGMWCGGGGGRGAAVLVSVVTGGYHYRSTYKWSHDDYILENEKFPIIYVTEGGIYKCVCSILPETSLKTETRFLVKKGKDREFEVLAPPAPSTESDDRSHVDTATLQRVFSSCDQLQTAMNTLQAALSQTRTDELKLLETFRQGSYGPVYQATWKGSTVAAHVISLTPSDLKKRQLDREIQTLKDVRHSNLSPCLDIKRNTTGLIFVSSAESGRCLQDMIFDDSYVMTSKDKVYILRQIGDALKHLHSLQPPLAHLDVKPTNVMVDPLTLHAVLSNFGLVRITHQLSSLSSEALLHGSAEFQAPEQLRAEAPSLPADVYAFGALTAVLFTEKSLWPGLTGFQIIQKVAQNECPSTRNLPEDVKLLCESCFISKPEARPQIGEVLKQLQNIKTINFFYSALCHQ